VSILLCSVVPEVAFDISHTAKPSEKKEKVSFPNSVIEKMSCRLTPLTEDRQPASFSIKINSD
jgi:hypothetical protein